jgi:K+-transporting ATPase ATPase C chain
MQREIAIALRATLATLLLTGLVYPFVMTGIAQLVAPAKANGSLVTDDAGQVVGSALIGQPFTKGGYLWPRPSAAGANGWDAAASSGSNLGTTSQKLHDRAAAEAERLRAANPDAPGAVPAELVAASASGLDPHLSPAAALWQAPRVARARNVDPERVRAVIESQVEPRGLGFLGEPRVNVLLANLALDRQFGRATE